MPKGNGKDEAQQAAEQAGAQDPGAEQEQPAEGQDGEQEQVRMPVLALVVANPANGSLGLQINEGVVTDKMAFSLAVAQLGLNSAMTQHHEQKGPQIMRPNPPGIIKPPGVL